MCFILALLGLHPSWPVVLAANRDEDRQRVSRAPFLWPEEPGLWAGRDEQAGGTWLGVNGTGMVVAITNRRDAAADPAYPSRGGLCLGALRQPSPAAAAQYLERELATRPQNPFNLLCASPSRAWATTWLGDDTVLEDGVHLVTNRGDPDDFTAPAAQRALDLLYSEDIAQLALSPLLAHLGRLCADTAGPDPICRVGGPRGTVSSSLIAVAPDGVLLAYQHASGPPSEQPFQSVLVPPVLLDQ